jgi:4-amino-4-deoxy-L-arabinose transferase-like glycosyltransferase
MHRDPLPPLQAPAKTLSRTLRQTLLLFFGLTLLLSLGNRALPLIDRDEPRFAEASREMLESRNWIVPTFNGAPRYDKPPLIYWLQSAAYQTLGEGELSARLPAALCTAATALLLIQWAARLGLPTGGWLAAGMFIFCVQIFQHGRAAVADAPMVLCVLAASWLGWEWIHQPQKHRLALGFWTVLALGFLAKGPIAFIPIGMTALLARRRSKEGLPAPSPVAWVAGLALLLALIGLWGVPALMQTQGAFASRGLGHHVLARSFSPLEGHGSKGLGGYLLTLPFYVVSLFVSFAPWSFWVPAALPFYRRSPNELSRYLASGVLLTFGIFTISRTKLPHYTLPCFPFLALLLAFWWVEHRPLALFRRVIWITGSIFVLVPILVFPQVRNLSASEAMALRLRDVLSPDASVALVDFEEPSLIWCLRRSLRTFPTKIPSDSVVEWLSKSGERCCILTAPLAETIKGPWIRRPVSGWNFAKGRRVQLVALTPPDAPPASQ